ncbi:hypothetical protein K439DRAFT_1622923 [Ramaria rubella]|nr:hypothetical protein K439DRAFT_1622923 [Ramaria rubella]
MPEGPGPDKGCPQSRDGIGPSKIIDGPRHHAPSVHMTTALEAIKVGNGTTKVSKTKIGIPLPKAALKGKVAIETKPTTTSKPIPNPKNHIAGAPLGQIYQVPPTQLSVVSEGDEAPEDGTSANKASSVILDSGSVDFYVPATADALDNGPKAYNTHNIALVEQFWPGTDDNQDSDYDETEEHGDITENIEMEDEKEEEETEAPRWFKSRVASLVGAAPIPPHALVLHPKEIVFIVPCHDQYGQDLTQKVPIPFMAAIEAIISAIQAVIGSMKLPISKHPPLIVKLNKSGTPRLALGTVQDWEQLKLDWLIDFNKKIPIEVLAIVPKKMLKDIEDAVRTNMGKKKKPVKKATNPYLSLDNDDNDGGCGDGKDLKPEHSDAYNQKVGLFKLQWPFSCGHMGTHTGIDLDNPPHTDSFKDWYFTPSSITRQAGAKLVEDLSQPPTSGGTHVTINMPPEAFQCNHQPPMSDQGRRHSPSSGSAHSASPIQSPDTPDVGTWLGELQVSANMPSIIWYKLTTKFENEDYLAMPLSSLAAFSSDLMRTSFGLTMQELSVVTERLKQAARLYRFVIRTDTGKSRGN